MRLEDLALESPVALLGLVPVALIAIYLLWRHVPPTLRFPGLALVESLPTTTVARLAWLPAALRITALVLIVVAIARPRLVSTPNSEETEGIDIVLAVDTSCSMRAADFEPNDRMVVAKKSIMEFVLQRTNDRIGLVVFGGEAASWVPLTLDYSLIGRMIDEVEVGMIEDGTAIGNALATSLNRLRSSNAESRVVVLLTDGDNNAGAISPAEAAQIAGKLGVRIYTILIGTDGPVPFPAGKDLWGRTIYQKQVLKTNPALLEKIAQKTGGQAYRATDKAELDARLSQVLDTLERTEIEATGQLRPFTELFPHAVLFALLLIGLELLLATTRFARYP